MLAATPMRCYLGPVVLDVVRGVRETLDPLQRAHKDLRLGRAAPVRLCKNTFSCLSCSNWTLVGEEILAYGNRLQGVPLFDTMQTRLLRKNCSSITSPWP